MARKVAETAIVIPSTLMTRSSVITSRIEAKGATMATPKGRGDRPRTPFERGLVGPAGEHFVM
jgi:hypothetical protein